MKWTLFMIAAFLIFTVGSFIWFVATWSDPDTVSLLSAYSETAA